MNGTIKGEGYGSVIILRPRNLAVEMTVADPGKEEQWSRRLLAIMPNLFLYGHALRM